ncbi:MAG: O-antigen ligase family protein, partial [Candidatus Omnitrophota bacterium]|nr:O-antigen ligase family protein [Candidatus Omnitrophota bacterium]
MACIIPALDYGSIAQSSIIVIHIAAALVLFLLLLQKYIDKDSLFVGVRIGKPAPALLFAIAASSFNSIYFFNTQLELQKIITYIIIFIATAAFFRTERRLKFLAYWIILCGTALAVIGIVKHLSGASFDKFWPRAEFATFISRNSFDTYVSMALALSLALIFCRIGPSARTLTVPASFIMVAASMLTPDRGGWFGLIALALFILALSGYEGMLKRKFWFVALFLIFFLWISALCVGLDKLIEKFIAVFVLNPKEAFLVDYDTTIWQRISVWKSSLEAAFNRPFLGVGLGNFRLAYPAFRGAEICNLVEYAHQDYLQFAVEAGIPALFSLICLGFFFFKRMVTEVKFKQGSFLTGLKIGALSGCFSMAFHCLYDFDFHIPSNAVLFMVL